MTKSFIQVKMDEDIMVQANNICEKLGISLSTYVNMSVVKLSANSRYSF